MPEYATFSFPTAMDVGPNAIDRLPDRIRAHGTRAFIVTDPGVRALPIYARLVALLDDAKIPWTTYSDISSDPRAGECERGAAAFRASGAEMIVGFGGGSALDAAKGVALMARHPGSIVEYDDAKGGYERITADIPALIAIPTTAGTGSEVGRSAVVVDEATMAKVVVFSPYMMPVLAILDPTLMVGLPRHLTAATGFDALTHNLEAIAAKGYHPLCDALALEGLAQCNAHLATATNSPEDLDARQAMAVAATMGAIAFQKGLGAAHSLAHPLSTLANMHHGLANAIVLPYIVRFNAEAAASAYATVAQRLGLNEPLDQWIEGLRKDLGIPHTLTEAGVDRGLLDALTEQAFADSCHASNPRPCSKADLRALYVAAFEG